MADDLTGNISQGGISLDKGAQLTIGAGDVVGRDKLVTNIQNIYQHALSAVEEAKLAREFERQELAQGVSAFVSRLQTRASETADAKTGGPYKGLLEYRLSDAELFFGRERAIHDLLQNLGRGPLTVLHSESGAGKTSLLQAGLSPQLIAAGHLPLYLRPYNLSPSVVIKRAFIANPGQLPLRDFLRQVCNVLGAQTTLYILLDQFEEAFTQLAETDREAFIGDLAECLYDDGLNVRWVLALRSEYFGNLANFRPRIRSPFENDYRLNRLTRVEAQEVIAKPAERQGLAFEPGLIDALLDDLGKNEIAPPQIQLVCLSLFEELEAGQTLITRALYEREGGAAGILRGHLERVLSRDLRPEQRAAARRLLETLISSEAQRVVRLHRDLVAEMGVKGVTPETLDIILSQLVDSRLLRANETDDGLVYELAHDYLLGEIKLDPDVQARKAAQELLEQEARAYRRYKTLLTEDRLKVIEPYIAELRLTAEAEQLLAESRAEVERERREDEARRQKELDDARKLAEETEARRKAETERAREAEQSSARLRARNRTLTIVGAVALLAAVAAVFFGVLSNRNATEAQRQSQISLARQLAAVALNQINADPERAVLLALEAYRTAPLFEAENALHQAFGASQIRLAFRGHTGEVWSARFSTDGQRIITASDDKTAIVWNAVTGEALYVLSGHNDAVLSARFSPDDKYVVTASKDGTARVWDAETSQEMKTLNGHEGAVRDAQFSPDGKLIVTAGEDGTVRIWDAASGREGRKWMAYPPIVFPVTATFNSDGTQIATIGGDGLARIWDATASLELFEFGGDNDCWPINLTYNLSGDILVTAGGYYYNACIWDAASGTLLSHRFTGHSLYISATALSPDDNYIATASWDKTARISNVATGEEIAVLRGHTSGIYTVAFAPTAPNLLLTAGDNTARLWETTPGVEWRAFSGSEQPLVATFSPDGRHIATGGSDGLVRVWNIEKPDDESLLLDDHLFNVGHPTYNSDGSLIAAPSDDGTVSIWNANSGREIKVLTESGGWIMHAVTFSHDNRLVVTAGRDNLVHIRDVATGDEIQPPLEDHTSFILEAAFSLDDTRLVTASMDGTARVWDVGTGKTLFTLKHGDGVVGVAYSPNGQWIATSSLDQTARLWDASTGAQVRVFNGHNAEVKDIAFSPDGTRLATASVDKTAIIWDVATGQELIRLVGAQYALLSITYSPDGKYLATTDANGILRLYLMQVEDLVALAESRITRQLTAEERLQFLQESPGR
ncbi:MAG: hypothetical protein HYZ49_01220 [Chloroflexi bacterium]|nr:hypothetical protein [Chloroflexota bacterium]